MLTPSILPACSPPCSGPRNEARKSAMDVRCVKKEQGDGRESIKEARTHEGREREKRRAGEVDLQQKDETFSKEQRSCAAFQERL